MKMLENRQLPTFVDQEVEVIFRDHCDNSPLFRDEIINFINY